MLEVKPIQLTAAERPDLLAQCPGQVFRLDEEVIDTVSFSRVMAQRNLGLILSVSGDPSFQSGAQKVLEAIEVSCAVAESAMTSGRSGAGERAGGPNAGAGALTGDGTATLCETALQLRPRHVVFAAGSGNERLRELAGLPRHATQTRPLHMVLVRGDLPILNGHCVDGAKTRVTVTTDVDSHGRTIWQVGGQIAEDGVRMESRDLIQHARRELEAVLPGWQAGRVEWSTYRIDRAEGRTPDGSRPDDVQVLVDQNVLTIWPTKLVLAPRAADRAIEHLGPFDGSRVAEFLSSLRELNWPVPPVAVPFWERETTWTSDV